MNENVLKFIRKFQSMAYYTKQPLMNKDYNRVWSEMDDLSRMVIKVFNELHENEQYIKLLEEDIRELKKNK